jgi:hypothetical protein
MQSALWLITNLSYKALSRISHVYESFKEPCARLRKIVTKPRSTQLLHWTKATTIAAQASSGGRQSTQALAVNDSKRHVSNVSAKSQSWKTLRDAASHQSVQEPESDRVIESSRRTLISTIAQFYLFDHFELDRHSLCCLLHVFLYGGRNDWRLCAGFTA